MSIASKLEKLETDITSAYNAIEDKNGTIPDNKNTENLAAAIESIQGSSAIEQATAEGENLSLTNTKAMPYSDYVVKGKSEQEGEPSPSNPSEIHSVADEGTVTIKQRGKNLFKNIPFTSTQRGLTITNDGNSIKVTGTAVSEYYSSIIFYADGSYENYEWWATDGKINPTKGYFNSNQAKNILSVISNNATTEPWFRLLIGRETQVEAINVNFGETSTTIFNENTEKINFIALGFLPDKTYNTEFKIQIEQGSTPTSYEPYQGNNYTFQTEPLRSLPNGVKDTIEADGIHRRVGRVVLDGTDNWSFATEGDNTNGKTFYSNRKSDMKSLTYQEVISLDDIFVISDTFKGYAFKELNKTPRKLNFISLGINTFLINISNETGVKTVEEFKTYLNNNPIVVQYQLNEETIEPPTQNQATTMLDIIKTGSYENTTNIYTDEDVKPTMKVDYYKKS